ncbi:RIIa domain-containing protein 1 [Hondaea fermentalgiana]|uniref:RIIa domain-containing protein 1 n=1 Tax=Hondaea fermentalgiana TaxID=2315210 RepID=A0A2R5GJF2_9STRA|nr:RIIa domain-containing protein 1 [Hondaea fermentalgiana]|eukprot:GBG30745.1 RIIa domain-containing protein 1 [Hondaea fermentalgiana]
MADQQNGASALTPEQQEMLNEKKVMLRLENEQYLRDHPELKGMLNKFFLKVLNERPDDIESFAAKYFTDSASYEAAGVKPNATRKQSGGDMPNPEMDA